MNDDDKSAHASRGSRSDSSGGSGSGGSGGDSSCGSGSDSSGGSGSSGSNGSDGGSGGISGIGGSGSGSGSGGSGSGGRGGARSGRVAVARGWANLSADLLDWVARGLSVAERLTAFERCCAGWRATSSGGGGWHSLRSASHPSKSPWLARLGGRLAKLRHLDLTCSERDDTAPLVEFGARLETLRLGGRFAVPYFVHLASGWRTCSQASAVSDAAALDAGFDTIAQAPADVEQEFGSDDAAAELDGREGGTSGNARDGEKSPWLIARLRTLCIECSVYAALGPPFTAAVSRLDALAECSLYTIGRGSPSAYGAPILRAFADNPRVAASLRRLRFGSSLKLDIEPLATFAELRVLVLVGFLVDSTALRELALPALHTLRVGGRLEVDPNSARAGVVATSAPAFPKLETLAWVCHATDDGWFLSLLEAHAPRLHTLTIGERMTVTDRNVYARAVATHRFPQLRAFSLTSEEDGRPNGPDEDTHLLLASFAGALLPQLDHLHIRYEWIAALTQVHRSLLGKDDLVRQGVDAAEPPPPPSYRDEARRLQELTIQLDPGPSVLQKTTEDVVRMVRSWAAPPTQLTLVGGTDEMREELARALPACRLVSAPPDHLVRERRLRVGSSRSYAW